MLTIALLFVLAGIGVSITGIGKARAQSPAPPQAPTATGGDTVKSDRRLHLVHVEDPVYPEIAKAAHVSGTVIMATTVNPNGDVIEAHVIRGEPMLNQAALNAVRLYKFAPFADSGDKDAKITVIVNVGPYDKAQKDTAKPDLSCTYYDGEGLGHTGTCDEANGQQYICRRNDGDNTVQSVQMQIGCKDKVEAFKKEHSLLEPREQFIHAWEARRTNQ
jgi:TonB family protein